LRARVFGAGAIHAPQSNWPARTVDQMIALNVDRGCDTRRQRGRRTAVARRRHHHRENRDARKSHALHSTRYGLLRGARPDWVDYARAAAQALGQRVAGLRGIDAAVESDVPIAAGLSSSSALLVATGLAILHANEVSIPSVELMELLARCERYVGTSGGGMD